MTTEQIREIEDHLSNEIPEAVFIGEPDKRHLYFPAICGVDPNGERIVYDRDKLVECLAREMNSTIAEAEEWVEFNVVRSLKHTGDHAPVIMETL